MTSQMLDIEEAWSNFCDGEYDILPQTSGTHHEHAGPLPKCSDLYISTKTKISYLSHQIPLKETFWKVPVIPYHAQQEGVIKKQMKFNSTSQEELDGIHEYLSKEKKEVGRHVDEYIITRIVNPEGRIKFKDVRKISIGLCKKDITSYRCKKKSAFYNCFVVIMRLMHEGSYKEIHVKVFNTGKLEIPGIQTPEVLQKVLTLLTNTLRPLVDAEPQLTYLRGKSETVLINSNFHCGYFINREKLFDLLKYKYNINSAYDPCSYPGIQSEFFFDPEVDVQTGQQPSADAKKKVIKVSFMIFRTGSVLIVGKCSEQILDKIYAFLKELLETEYKNVGGALVSKDDTDSVSSQKTRKSRKKTITITCPTSE